MNVNRKALTEPLFELDAGRDNIKPAEALYHLVGRLGFRLPNKHPSQYFSSKTESGLWADETIFKTGTMILENLVKNPQAENPLMQN